MEDVLQVNNGTATANHSTTRASSLESLQLVVHPHSSPVSEPSSIEISFLPGTPSFLSGAPSLLPEEHIGAESILLGLFCSLLVLLAVTGNVLVIASVLTDRHLRRPGNYFVISLALADTLVAMTVMTFALINDVTGEWMFGQIVCRIWLSSDVMCSTASILNLFAISLDRYIHIRSPLRYEIWVTHRRALLSIAVIWVMSALISFVPIQMGWHQLGNEPDKTLNNTHFSLINNTQLHTIIDDTNFNLSNIDNTTYTFHSSIESEGTNFSLNLVSCLNASVQQHTDQLHTNRLLTLNDTVKPCISSEVTWLVNETEQLTFQYNVNSSGPLDLDLAERVVYFESEQVSLGPEVTWGTSPGPETIREGRCDLNLNRMYAILSSLISFYLPCFAMILIYFRLQRYARRHVETIKSTYKYAPPTPLLPTNHSQATNIQFQPIRGYKISDHKAAMTLGIIMGVFLICWTPFFTINICGAFCDDCIPVRVYTLVTWLGYANSAMNPFIYSITNRQFRSAFKRVLNASCRCFFCCCHGCYGNNTQQQQLSFGSVDGCVKVQGRTLSASEDVIIGKKKNKKKKMRRIRLTMSHTVPSDLLAASRGTKRNSQI